MAGIFEFVRGCVREVARGGRAYRIWMAALVVIIAVGASAYARPPETTCRPQPFTNSRNPVIVRLRSRRSNRTAGAWRAPP